jgi:hypothetical protein
VLIRGVEFEYGSPADVARNPDGMPWPGTPAVRYANARGLSLNRYGSGPFARLVLRRLPLRPGVYAVVNGSDGVLYIGKASDSLAQRWDGYATIQPRNCFTGGQSTNCRINALILEAITAGRSLAVHVHETPEPIPLETRLIATVRPPWNIRA